MNIDLNELDFSNAGNWPLPVKLIAILVVCAAVGFAGYWFDTKEQLSALDKSRVKEEELKSQIEDAPVVLKADEGSDWLRAIPCVQA